MNNLDTYVAGQRDRMMAELMDLLRIPSVSTSPDHASECRRAADWVADHLRALGCPKVELLASETHPVVYAEGPKVPGKPTVVVYGHYDVQPAEPLELWDTPPYEPTIRDGSLFARGATDDKGQFFSIVKAFEVVSRDGPPPVNVRFLIEGQEESGSAVLFKLLEDHPELVEADAALVADTQYYAPGWPALEVGLRGICYGEITVRTLKGDLHSGLYGGAAPTRTRRWSTCWQSSSLPAAGSTSRASTTRCSARRRPSATRGRSSRSASASSCARRWGPRS